MRDHHFTTGAKRYYEDLEAGIAAVARAYPGARREGSTGGWSWTVGGVEGVIVAEAWMHRTRPGWWVRIKPADHPGRLAGSDPEPP